MYMEDLKILKDYSIPSIWVYGNHCSWTYMAELGIHNLHLKTFEFWWLVFWWFEGCVKYKEWKFQYTQEEAQEMIKQLPRVDVLISHCPPFGINDDQDDIAHIGFKALNNYIEVYKPKYIFHWHTYDKGDFITEYNWTKIVYVHRDKIIEI
jgi:Icc-related predicted phosphoesterase